MSQRAFNPAQIINRPGLQFSYLGVFGIVVFLLLRHSFDFHLGISNAITKQEAKTTALQAASALSMEMSDLNLLSLRFTDPALHRQLQQELPGNPSPQQLNRSDIPISGWEVLGGREIEELGLFTGAENLFVRTGVFRAKITNAGRMVNFESGQNGEIILGFPPDQANLAELTERAFGHTVEGFVFSADTGSGNITTHTFTRDTPGFGAPQRISYRIQELNANNAEPQFRLLQFSAQFSTNEPDPLPEPSVFWQTTSVLLLVVLFGLLILITSIRQVFRGRMEWKRALFIFGSVTLVQYLWHVLYLAGSYYAFFNTSLIGFDQLSQLINASIFGLYAASAYVAWESLARELKSGQIPVIDAVWRFDVMKHEVGAGILTGYGFAGFYFALLALSLFSFDLLLLPRDSLFDPHRDSVSLAPGVSVFMNSWLTAMIFVIAHVSLLYNIISFSTRSDKVRMGLSMVIAAVSMFILLPPFGSDGNLAYIFIVCLLLSIPLVMAYRFFGIVSAIISWFIFYAGLRLLSLGAIGDFFFSWHSLLLAGALIAPFALGLVSTFYGKRLEDTGTYLPAYEEINQKRMRSEKELAIAKESQFNLLPARAPELPRLDVYGFFLPSYEVGGDFYDYQVLNSPEGQPEKMALSIVDVSGKGMQAAFNAIFTSGLLLGRIKTDSPAGVLTQINPTLCKKTDAHTFITCQVGYIGLSDLMLEMANAGHCPPLLKRTGKCTYLTLPAPRFPLGFIQKVTYINTQTQLQKGDLLLFYSDGLPEAQSPTGDRMDFDQLLRYIESLETDTKSSSEICGEIKRYILTFSNYELADDTTLICIKITG